MVHIDHYIRATRMGHVLDGSNPANPVVSNLYIEFLC